MAKKVSKSRTGKQQEDDYAKQEKGAIMACIIILQRLVLSPAVRLSAEQLAEQKTEDLKNKMESIWSIVKS